MQVRLNQIISMNASPPLPGWARLGDGFLGSRWLRIVLAAALALAAARHEMLAQQGVGDPPRITNQPVSQVVLVGATVSFHVGVAASATPLVYQWYTSSIPIPDGTNATLWLPNVQTDQAGQYWVTVANAAGSPDPLVVDLTVIGPGGVGCTDMLLGGTATQMFDNFGVINQPNDFVIG